MSGAGGSAGAPREGQLIAGKYRVTRVLGQGGMGYVVAAHHELLQSQVAIKFLLPEAAADAQFVARFLREAQTAATIRSEHVARVLDVGKTDDEAPFMVMEYLEGVDLSARVERDGPLPIHEAVDHVLQACEALAEAHAAGLVHRDIKPSNLFLTHRPDGSPLIKLLDFGIAKAATESSGKLTTTGITMGSPSYMSPEQIRNARSVDARSDVWSLGATLHELLTGSPPFLGDSAAAQCAAIAADPPTRLRERRPEAPAGLEEVILRCLEKLPAQRTPDVATLSSELLPYASPRAELSVERINKTLGVTPHAMSGAASRHSAPRISATPATSPFSSTVAAMSTVAGAGAGAAPPRRRAPTVLIGLAAGIGAGILAVLVALQGQSPDASAMPEAKATTPAPSASAAPAAQAQTAPSIAPAPSGAPSAPEVIPAAVTSANAPPGAPSATTLRPPPTTPAKPTPARPTGPRHVDPFADQH